MSILDKKQSITTQLQFCIDKAKSKGVDACEVYAHSSQGTDIEVRMSQVERLEFSQDRSLSLTLYSKQKKSTVSTTDFSEEALTALIDKACSIVQHTEADQCNGLADKEVLAFDYPDLDLYHPWEIDANKMIDQLAESEQKALSLDKRLTNSDGVSLSTSNTLYAYANSHDFYGQYRTSSHSYSACLVAKENDQMQRDYEYTVNRVADKLENFEQVALKAAEKSVSMLGAKPIKTQASPIIFIAPVARGIFANFLGAISGRNLYNESSFLLDYLNKPVFHETIQVIEDPYVKQGLGSVPFDADGVKLKRRELVKNGILNGYLLNTYSANRLGMQTTGNAGGAHNILVKDHGKDFDALIKDMHQGLIVTEMMGHGVNMVTGDYSRGAAGFWVENGKIAYPVQEITVAGNLKDMFLGMTSIANDIDKRGKIQTGSILIDNMTIAGI